MEMQPLHHRQRIGKEIQALRITGIFAGETRTVPAQLRVTLGKPQSYD
jgi:hypothetical protein